VDLSEQLRVRKNASAPAPAPQRAADAGAGPSAAGAAVAAQQRALFRRGRASSAHFAANPPSKGEARRWERNNRFAKRVRARMADAVSSQCCGLGVLSTGLSPLVCQAHVCCVSAYAAHAGARAACAAATDPACRASFEAVLGVMVF